jgi:23S rRNA (uracil1939-C5)-methyltransferase
MVATDGAQGSTSKQLPQRGALVELVVESLAHGTGLGVGRLQLASNDSFVVLVHAAIPGERVRARIIRRKSNFAEALVVERLDPPSPYATTPLCRHFLEGCGGCKFQNLTYAKQLAEKEDQVRMLYRSLFRKLEAHGIASEMSVEFLPAIGAADPEGLYAYRNKMEFTFGTRRWHPSTTTISLSPDTEANGKHAVAGEASVSPKSKPDARGVSAKAARDDSTDFALGLHAPRRYDKVLCIEDCALQIDLANEILRFVERRCRPLAESVLLPYDPVHHTGFLRNLVIRHARDRNNLTQVMVNVVTSPPADARQQAALEEIAAELWKEFGATHRGLVCVLQNITSNRSGVAVGQVQQRLAGHQDTIEQYLHPLRLLTPQRYPSIDFMRWSNAGIRFQISANSFFQTNPSQAERLLAVILESSGLLERYSSGGGVYRNPRPQELVGNHEIEDCSTPGPLVVDLFCGTGTIALCLARFSDQVLGLELVASAVEDARTNARLNGISNAVFEVANLDKEDLWQLILRRMPAAEERPIDVLVMDPPRAGVHARQLKAIAVAPRFSRPRRIVYVSCNPATQTRDLELLLRDAPWYALSKVAMVDQFPHTPHIETVAVLELKEDADSFCVPKD